MGLADGNAVDMLGPWVVYIAWNVAVGCLDVSHSVRHWESSSVGIGTVGLVDVLVYFPW